MEKKTIIPADSNVKLNMGLDSNQEDLERHLASGIHIIADCQGIEAKRLNDASFLRKILIEGLEKAGATILDLRVKTFRPSGVTIFALLAESHASIHTYPKLGIAMLDLFTCGKINAQLGMKIILEHLQPTQSEIKMINRNVTETVNSHS